MFLSKFKQKNKFDKITRNLKLGNVTVITGYGDGTTRLSTPMIVTDNYL